MLACSRYTYPFVGLFSTVHLARTCILQWKELAQKWQILTVEVLGLIVDEIDAKRAQNPGFPTSSSSIREVRDNSAPSNVEMSKFEMCRELPAMDHSSHALDKGQDGEAA